MPPATEVKHSCEPRSQCGSVLSRGKRVARPGGVPCPDHYQPPQVSKLHHRCGEPPWHLQGSSPTRSTAASYTPPSSTAALASYRPGSSSPLTAMWRLALPCSSAESSTSRPTGWARATWSLPATLSPTSCLTDRAQSDCECSAAMARPSSARATVTRRRLFPATTLSVPGDLQGSLGGREDGQGLRAAGPGDYPT